MSTLPPEVKGKELEPFIKQLEKIKFARRLRNVLILLLVGVTVWNIDLFPLTSFLIFFTFIPLYNAKKKFRTLYKQKLVLVFKNRYETAITYNATGGILSKQAFDALPLFVKSFKYSTEDYINYSDEEYGFEFCEINAIHKTRKSSAESFVGGQYRFMMKTPFKMSVVLMQDYEVGFVNKMVQHMLNLPKKVTLELKLFEKLFEVYCDDDIYARYVLTPRFQEILSEIVKKYSHYGVSILCDGEYMDIFISDSFLGRFEPVYSLEDILTQLKTAFKEIDEMIELSKKLNLEMHPLNVNAL